MTDNQRRAELIERINSSEKWKWAEYPPRTLDSLLRYGGLISFEDDLETVHKITPCDEVIEIINNSGSKLSMAVQLNEMMMWGS